MDVLRAAWRRFSAVMERVGNFQARVILTVFYFLIAAPFAIGLQLTSDPLRLRVKPGTSGWVERQPLDTSLEAARRQY